MEKEYPNFTALTTSLLEGLFQGKLCFCTGSGPAQHQTPHAAFTSKFESGGKTCLHSKQTVHFHQTWQGDPWYWLEPYWSWTWSDESESLIPMTSAPVAEFLRAPVAKLLSFSATDIHLCIGTSAQSWLNLFQRSHSLGFSFLLQSWFSWSSYLDF